MYNMVVLVSSSHFISSCNDFHHLIRGKGGIVKEDKSIVHGLVAFQFYGHYSSNVINELISSKNVKKMNDKKYSCSQT